MFLKSFPPIKITDKKVPNVKSSGSVLLQCQVEGICLYFLQINNIKTEQLWRQSGVMNDRKSTFYTLAFHVLLPPGAEG